MNARIQIHYDICFCIDISGSMVPFIDLVKEKLRKFPHDLRDALAKKNKIVDTLRNRVVTFGSLDTDPGALSASDFFVVEPSTDLARFESFVNGLSASGGGDGPESALEALGVAQASAWTHEGDRQRHVIVMFTDAGAHKLEDRVGEVPGAFRDQVPSSLDELTDRWDGNQAVRLKEKARRLVIFAPDAYPWNVLGDSWGQMVWLPSQVDRGLEFGNDEYEALLSLIVSSI